MANISNGIWLYAHPSITEKCQKHFSQANYALAVECGLQEIITRIRNFRDANGLEEIRDDIHMMDVTFNKDGNSLKFNGLSSEIEKNIQIGYAKIFSGVTQALGSHNTDNISEGDAVRKLMIFSDLMHKIDEALSLLWKDYNKS